MAKKSKSPLNFNMHFEQKGLSASFVTKGQKLHVSVEMDMKKCRGFGKRLFESIPMMTSIMAPAQPLGDYVERPVAVGKGKTKRATSAKS